MLNRRCRGHESNMRRADDSIVSKHYKEYNHTTDDNIVTAIGKETDYNKRFEIRRSLDFPPRNYASQRTQ